MPKIKIIIKIIIINNNKYINTEPILSYKNKDCTTEFFFSFIFFFILWRASRVELCIMELKSVAVVTRTRPTHRTVAWISICEELKQGEFLVNFFLQVNYNRIKYIIFFYIIFQIQMF